MAVDHNFIAFNLQTPITRLNVIKIPRSGLRTGVEPSFRLYLMEYDRQLLQNRAFSLGGILMAPIVVFDVNETLLDPSALDPEFEASFGTAAVRKEWFNQLLLFAFVTTLTGSYQDFGEIGKAALAAIEEKHQKSLSSEQRSRIFETMRKLPPYADVKDGLERLYQGGSRLMALTNSGAEMAQMQLKNADLLGNFERVFSTDSVRRFKPAPDPYRMTAKELGVGTESLLMVAAHSWDIAGAMKAGCHGAFLVRPGQVLDSLTPKPDFIAPDLQALTEQILKKASITAQ